MKWNWAGHVASRNDDRWTKIVMQLRLTDKRRLYQRWTGRIVKFCGSENWMRRA